MLHRVVMKRSGRRALASDASDFTAADHLICTIVRQARNFPPAAGILHVEGESICTRRRYHAQKRPPASQTGGPHAKRSDQNWHRHSKTGFSCATRFPNACTGKLFSFPVPFNTTILYLRQMPAAPCQSSQCPGPIVPSLYSVRLSVKLLVWPGDK